MRAIVATRSPPATAATVASQETHMYIHTEGVDTHAPTAVTLSDVPRYAAPSAKTVAWQGSAHAPGSHGRSRRRYGASVSMGTTCTPSSVTCAGAPYPITTTFAAGGLLPCPTIFLSSLRRLSDASPNCA